MKSSLSLVLSLGLYGTAHAQIDRSAGALIDRASQRYAHLKSFSTTATTTGYTPRGVLRSRIQLSYQPLQRASVVTSSLDDKGRVRGVLSRQLVGANSFYSSNFDAPADVKPIKTNDDRAAFLLQIKGSPLSLASSVMSLAEPPERDPKTGKQRVTIESLAREGKLRSMTRRKVGKSTQVKVVLAPPSPQQPPLVLTYGLNTNTLYLESLRLEVASPDKKLRSTYIAKFSAPISNWKGSQSATDRQIYNWKVVAPGIEVQQGVKPTISVEPAARAILARAATLYGNLKTWRLKWRESGASEQFGPNTPQNKSIAFDRAGRLRIEDPEGLDALIIVDGKNRYTLDTPDPIFNEPTTYTREEVVYDDDVSVLDEFDYTDESGQFLGGLLAKENLLEPEQVRLWVSIEKLREFTAKVLPSQPFNGQPCDIVRLTTRFVDPYTTRTGQTVKQRTFWLAQDDGRLVRWQTKSVEGNAKPTTTDALVQSQDLNPTFSNEEFKFVPPKGAVLKSR